MTMADTTAAKPHPPRQSAGSEADIDVVQVVLDGALHPKNPIRLTPLRSTGALDCSV
jgi:hypothetical protein